MLGAVEGENGAERIGALVDVGNRDEAPQKTVAKLVGRHRIVEEMQHVLLEVHGRGRPAATPFTFQVE